MLRSGPFRFQPFLYSINVILQSQGASLANIVDMTVFLTNMGDYGAMNEVSMSGITHV